MRQRAAPWLAISSGVKGCYVQGLVSKQQAAASPKRASAAIPDTCMEGIETCFSAAWSSLSVPSAGSPFSILEIFVFKRFLALAFLLAKSPPRD